jgi:serine/threonine protein kinase
MPMARPIDDFPAVISKAVVETLFVSIRAALLVLHSAGYCHCDVKVTNVLKSSNGDFILCDYDACVLHGETVNLSTREYWTKDFIELEQSGNFVQASPKLDFSMLAVMLWMEMGNPWFASDRKSLASMMNHAQGFLLDSKQGAQSLIDCVQLALSS